MQRSKTAATEPVRERQELLTAAGEVLRENKRKYAETMTRRVEYIDDHRPSRRDTELCLRAELLEQGPLEYGIYTRCRGVDRGCLCRV